MLFDTIEKSICPSYSQISVSDPDSFEPLEWDTGEEAFVFGRSNIWIATKLCLPPSEWVQVFLSNQPPSISPVKLLWSGALFLTCGRLLVGDEVSGDTFITQVADRSGEVECHIFVSPLDQKPDCIHIVIDDGEE